MGWFHGVVAKKWKKELVSFERQLLFYKNKGINHPNHPIDYFFPNKNTDICTFYTFNRNFFGVVQGLNHPNHPIQNPFIYFLTRQIFFPSTKIILLITYDIRRQQKTAHKTEETAVDGKPPVLRPTPYTALMYILWSI